MTTAKSFGASSEEEETPEREKTSSPMVGFRVGSLNARDDDARQQQNQFFSLGDEWNDSALVNAYNSAIKSYASEKKKTTKKKSKNNAKGDYLMVPAQQQREMEKKEKTKKKTKKTVTASQATEEEEEEER